jgi:hypothetical protein
MQAFPSAFCHHVSSAIRIFVPRAWIAKVHNRRRPADRRRARPRLRNRRSSRSAKRHIKMRMRHRCRPAAPTSPSHRQPCVPRLAGIPARTSLIVSPSIRHPRQSSIGGDNGAVLDQDSHCYADVPRPSVICNGPTPQFQYTCRASPLVRSSHVSGQPKSTSCTIVMQSSTGHTSEHRLQPTHSVSSTRGIRASGVGYHPELHRRASSLGIGVTAIDAWLTASISRGFGAPPRAHPPARSPDPDECTGARHPSKRVAEIAADAFLLIDARNDFVVQIQVLPLRHASAATARENPRSFRKALLAHPVQQPSAMSSTMR